ncbi:acyl carrier protein [Cellulomonas wangsupingiae]|uniref:Acyl carrier protein n=1 Tax=Cellulomonas wangsupingiae TaxID=2968085 RepID=A0ABY5KCC3_9CELL|nr:acyl carrier protein [Cellulomonas wangsupingiae]MCC2333029.1 acyl carrier protein [Cellulomonas wangsupingiae]UUI66745.1 acyl carrier protein [Cellulomonas wangsupingiae]
MDEVEVKVRTTLARVVPPGVDVPALPADADLVEDVGLDSLRVVALLTGIEDELGVECEPDLLDEPGRRSVRALVEHLSPLVADARGDAARAAGTGDDALRSATVEAEPLVR